MTIKVAKQVETEIEVNFPVYRSWGFSCYKIIDEENYEEVESGCYGIGVKCSTNKGIVGGVLTESGSTEITREEYYQRRSEVVDELLSKKTV